MTARPPRRIFLVAGESSGDVLGARLIRALRRLTAAGDGPAISFSGVGGPMMEAAGLETSLFPMRELSVMGLVEILPHAPRLLRRLRETARAVERLRPDLVVTIDSPGFAHRLAARLIACPATAAIPRVHYVAPSVWAWRPGRVFACKRHFHHLLALLPFEPPFFEKAGLPCDFVGHPVLESGADRGDGPGFRQRHGIAPEAPLVCLLPGSRPGEAGRLLPVFGQAATLLHRRIPGLRIVTPVADPVRDQVLAALDGWPGQPVAVFDEREKFDAMAASGAALAASGTVALELALARVPTVIAYRLSPLTYFLLRRMARVRYVHLLNILLDRAAAPERLQADCRPERLAEDMARLLGPDGDRQIRELAPALAALRPPGDDSPAACAARILLGLSGKKQGRE